MTTKYGLLLSALALLIAGCAGPKVDLTAQPEVEGALAPTSRNSAEMAYTLSSDTWCSNDEAFSLVLLMVDEEDRYTSFEQRRAALLAKGLIEENWQLDGAAPITKGVLATIVCRALEIKGGVILHTFPGLPRYAYREAAHEGLMYLGSEWEPLTGPEVVGVLGRAARRQMPADDEMEIH